MGADEPTYNLDAPISWLPSFYPISWSLRDWPQLDKMFKPLPKTAWDQFPNLPNARKHVCQSDTDLTTSWPAMETTLATPQPKKTSCQVQPELMLNRHTGNRRFNIGFLGVVITIENHRKLHVQISWEYDILPRKVRVRTNLPEPCLDSSEHILKQQNDICLSC